MDGDEYQRVICDRSIKARVKGKIYVMVVTSDVRFGDNDTDKKM